MAGGKEGGHWRPDPVGPVGPPIRTVGEMGALGAEKRHGLAAWGLTGSSGRTPGTRAEAQRWSGLLHSCRQGDGAVTEEGRSRRAACEYSEG